MLLVKCAWHRQWWGYPKFLRVGSWRGWRLTWSHGICSRCRRRLNDDATTFGERMALHNDISEVVTRLEPFHEVAKKLIAERDAREKGA